MLLARGGDAPVLVFEDDASFAVADVSTWFRDTLLPQLPDDWAFCYLNEPLHIEMNRERSHRQTNAQQQQQPQLPWRGVCASDESHEYTACLRHVYVSGDAETMGMMPPTTEAYAVRPAAAQALIKYTLSHGWCAVDYILAHTFATSGTELSPSRVFLCDPPMSYQPQRERDSDIQNYMLVGNTEMDAVELQKVLLARALAAKHSQARQARMEEGAWAY